MRQLAESSKIIVAKVQGKVNAGGIGLVAGSDLVVADNEASFALSELLFGLLPAMVLPFLIQRVGLQRAKLLALTTQPIQAAEAQRWGLVDEIGADPKPSVAALSATLAALIATGHSPVETIFAPVATD